MNIVPDVLAAVLNSLAPSLAVACLAWLVLRATSANAATRYVVWWAVLAALIVLPCASRLRTMWPARIASASVAEPPAPEPPQITYPGGVDYWPPALVVRQDRAPKWTFAALALWAVFFLWRLARLGRGYLYLRGVKRRAAPSTHPLPNVGRRALLLISSEIGSPAAAGFFNPAVILPEGLTAQIAPLELDHILLHESAHLARKDDWWNLLARLLDAALGLHPVIWRVLKQIEQEREAACDDWVVARTGAARAYAESLAHMTELLQWQGRGQQLEPLASGVFGHRSRIRERIEMLLSRGREFSSRVSGARVATISFVLLAITAAASFAPRWIVFAQSPKFEVADVKVNKSNNPSSSVELVDGRLRAVNLTMAVLIRQAWHIHPDQLIGGPGWLDRDRFDVIAKTDPAATQADMRLMTRQLLIDRFHLAVHQEEKVLSAFVLSQSKKGVKAREDTPATDDDGPLCQRVAGVIGDNHFRCRHITPEELARQLPVWAPGYVNTVVLDRTGLTASYQFELDWTPAGMMNGGAASRNNPAIHPDELTNMTLFDALEAQLGLRLESAKVPVPVVVIDHIEEVPTEN